MDYETGTASGVIDLLDKLAVFANDNGWTVDYNGVRTSGSGEALQLTKGEMACTFIANTSSGTVTDPGHFFGVYQHDVYDAGDGTENQGNGSTKLYANAMSGPYQAYHFMTGDESGSDYLYVVVETSAGTYKHILAGKLVGFGELDNGHFVAASRWDYNTSYINSWASERHAVPFDTADNESNIRSTEVRADGDAISPRWYSSYSSDSSLLLGGGVREAQSLAGGDRRGTVYPLAQVGASAITGRAVLLPCWLTGARGSGFYSPLGWPPGVRWVKLDYLTPGDILTLGAEEWKVFPVIRKNGAAGQPNSGTFGYAYRVSDGS